MTDKDIKLLIGDVAILTAAQLFSLKIDELTANMDPTADSPTQGILTVVKEIREIFSTLGSEEEMIVHFCEAGLAGLDLAVSTTLDQMKQNGLPGHTIEQIRAVLTDHEEVKGNGSEPDSTESI